jgi:hypothetical protein
MWLKGLSVQENHSNDHVVGVLWDVCRVRDEFVSPHISRLGWFDLKNLRRGLPTTDLSGICGKGS